MRLALHTWTLDATPLAEALQVARATGWDAVELRRLDFARRVATQNGFHLPLRSTNGTNGPGSGSLDFPAGRYTVRFDGWQDTHAGEREVKIALRKTLFKYRLHQDTALFERAYGYIREYY